MSVVNGVVATRRDARPAPGPAGGSGRHPDGGPPRTRRAPRTPSPPRHPGGAGSIRRTTNIDTLRPDGLRADAVVDARARDLRTNLDGTSEVVAEATLQARISPTRELLWIRTSPDVPALRGLLGASVGPGFRSRVNAIVTDGCEDGSLLYLLLDDLPGATLVSGYALHRGGALDEGAARRRPRSARPTAAPKASATGPFPDFGAQARHLRRMGARRHHDGPRARHGIAPRADRSTGPDPRRRRRSAVVARHGGPGSARRAPPPPARPARATRQASGSIGSICTSATATWTTRGARRSCTSTRCPARSTWRAGRIGTVSARAHVLPWVECPGALASAQRVDGMELSALRTRVRKEFVGRSTCTHLNDSLRSLADVTALHLALGIAAGVTAGAAPVA